VERNQPAFANEKAGSMNREINTRQANAENVAPKQRSEAQQRSAIKLGS
jgi:hypothetical protein